MHFSDGIILEPPILIDFDLAGLYTRFAKLPFREFFYGYLFRLIAGIVIVILSVILLIAWGLISNWHYTNQMIFSQMLFIVILMFIAEHLRSKMYSRRTIPKDGIRSELLVLITDLPLSNSEIIVDKKNGSLIRLVDILIGISAILVFWPIVILVALAIKFDSKGPVFTKNSRLGKHLIEVELLSFRTTTLPSGLPMAIQTNSGRFLKYSSLDRLPWFFNLLKGDVSLIGPNPMRMTEIKELSENTIEMYSNIRPGIISGYMTEFFYQPNQLRYETKETLNDFRTAELQYHFAASYFDYLKVVWKAIFLVLTRSGEV